MNGPGAHRFLLRPVVDLVLLVMALTGGASPGFMPIDPACDATMNDKVYWRAWHEHEDRMACDPAYAKAYNAMHE